MGSQDFIIKTGISSIMSENLGEAHGPRFSLYVPSSNMSRFDTILKRIHWIDAWTRTRGHKSYSYLVNARWGDVLVR